MKFGTKGTMGVDYEKRIDFGRLQRQRVEKIHKELEKTDFSCLILFDNHNKRYATSTAVASPEVDDMGRYAIIPRNGDPYIFGFGSEVAAEKLNCPWIADRAFPAHTTMFGALPKSFGLYNNFLADHRGRYPGRPAHNRVPGAKHQDRRRSGCYAESQAVQDRG